MRKTILVLAIALVGCNDNNADMLVSTFMVKARQIADEAYQRGYGDGILKANCSCMEMIEKPPKNVLWPDACGGNHAYMEFNAGKALYNTREKKR